jgi:hypothetical protein
VLKVSSRLSVTVTVKWMLAFAGGVPLRSPEGESVSQAGLLLNVKE